MPILRLRLDRATYDKLVAIAAREWRRVNWQAELLLRESVRKAHDGSVAPAVPGEASFVDRPLSTSGACCPRTLGGMDASGMATPRDEDAV